MFSLFENGIKDTKCSKFIGFSDLVRIIRNNPNAGKIETIRNLRKNGDEYYKTLKSELPNITPTCLVRERNLEEDNFDRNFIQFSQYLYFDIDKWNTEEYKCYFIKKYGNSAALICLSSSGGGLSVLFKVKNIITKDNFNEIWQKVRDTVLSDEIIDVRCKNISRAMFISHDPAVFYNYENEIELEIKNPDVGSDKKTVKQSKTCKDFNYRLISPFSIISIDKVLQKIVLRTIVPVINPVVDFKPAEYVEVYIPKHIKDGTKHVIYTSMIHALVYLNPTVEREYIFSYMFYVNSRFAKPGMEKREFIRLFNLVYNGIKDTGKTNVKKTIKYVHFNPGCGLSVKQKIEISNMLNGIKRKNESIEKINNAKSELKQAGRKITQKGIAEISKLSSKTIRSHINAKLLDMDEHVEMVNNSVIQEQSYQ
jgi:hypothetical protein